MPSSRRVFFSSLAGFGAVTFLAAQAPPTIHQPINMPPKPTSGSEVPEPQSSKAQRKDGSALVAREEELRNATDQLLIKVQEFRSKLDGTHTADVFSVGMYKATEEIEKLAKQLKNRARP